MDVLAIGNAIVDVLVHGDDELLAQHGLVKGTMRLVEAEAADRLYADLGPAVEMSGGSAANTAVGVASLGGRAGFVGRRRDDQLGHVFEHDIQAAGVSFSTPAATTGPATARCLIIVTPDAQRTMNTFLGASAELAPDDIDAEAVAAASVTYLEGYLWDAEPAKAAMREAATQAQVAGRRVAFTLSDPFCVDRHRAEFRSLLADVDVLFANEIEVISLFEAAHLEAALPQLQGQVAMAAVTRSEKGSIIVADGAVHEVPAARVGEVVDTTGAGDLYAAGFLFGLTRGMGPADCGRLGSLCAAEVISHMGARPQVSLAELAQEQGILT